MADAGRKQRWSYVQTIAWVAFRSLGAVRIAAKLEHETKTPLRRLVMFAVANHFRQHITDSPPRAVTAAVDAVEQATRDKKLSSGRDGRYRANDVKSAFPSKEGRGRGPGKKLTGMWANQIRQLGWLFLTERKTADWDWHGLFQRCRDDGIATSKKQYEKVRPAALVYAEKELAARICSGIGIMNAQLPLSPEEAKTCEANIRSWKQRGRPRGSGVSVE
jgi:hypothetical protein